MRWKKKEDPLERLLSSEEFAQAAERAMEAYLSRLPEPEECEHEFSPEFEAKMKRLFAKERRKRVCRTVRRYAAAILLICLIGGGGVLTVNAEARESFLRWTREAYEGSILYTFFEGEPTEGLPVYELGWVPEGYEKADVYRDEETCSAIYMKTDDSELLFAFNYSFKQAGDIYEVLFDESKYELQKVEFNATQADFYMSLDGTETNDLIWLDENRGVVFLISGHLNKEDILHIAKEVFLCEMTN